MNVTALARKFGVDRRTIQRRLKKGWTPPTRRTKRSTKTEQPVPQVTPQPVPHQVPRLVPQSAPPETAWLCPPALLLRPPLWLRCHRS